MAKLDIGSGLDDFLKSWGNLEERAPAILKMGVYDGAHVVFGEMKSQIDRIPDSALVPGNPEKSQKYREGLKSHLGSSSIYTEDGYTGEAFTMADYIEDSKRKGDKVAAAMIARSANKGTSFSTPSRWIDKAMKAAKAPAEEAIAKTVEEELAKTFGE